MIWRTKMQAKVQGKVQLAPNESKLVPRNLNPRRPPSKVGLNVITQTNHYSWPIKNSQFFFIGDIGGRALYLGHI